MEKGESGGVASGFLGQTEVTTKEKQAGTECQMVKRGLVLAKGAEEKPAQTGPGQEQGGRGGPEFRLQPLGTR